MEVSAKAGIDNKGLTSVGDEVASVAELPIKSVSRTYHQNCQHK